jgi:hypothetical protein
MVARSGDRPQQLGNFKVRRPATTIGRETGHYDVGLFLLRQFAVRGLVFHGNWGADLVGSTGHRKRIAGNMVRPCGGIVIVRAPRCPSRMHTAREREFVNGSRVFGTGGRGLLTI